MDKVFAVIASPIPFILLISVVITVHELGHYWTGRIFNAAAESFSIGFGKSLVEFKDKRGTRWRINWLPIGGFVKFVGEVQAPQDHKVDGEHPRPVGPVGRTFSEIGPLPRMAIAFGGPLANFIFAVIVYAAMGIGLGLPAADQVRVTEVLPGSPAATAGFQTGDIIKIAGGREVTTSNDVIRATFLSAGEAVDYKILRGGQEMDISATPASHQERNDELKVTEKVGRVGLKLEDIGLHVRRLNPIEAIGYGASSTGDAIANTVNVLRRLVTGKDGLDKMSGPVGIFSLADNVTDMHMKQQGVPLGEKLRGLALQLIELAAMLSIGVGFFNLLPIPVLDGGAIILCGAEAAMGREVPEKVQRVGLTIGLACLVSFALVVTWQDIARMAMPWLPGGS